MDSKIYDAFELVFYKNLQFNCLHNVLCYYNSEGLQIFISGTKEYDFHLTTPLKENLAIEEINRIKWCPQAHISTGHTEIGLICDLESQSNLPGPVITFYSYYKPCHDCMVALEQFACIKKVKFECHHITRNWKVFDTENVTLKPIKLD
jgi:hypothetical protein